VEHSIPQPLDLAHPWRTRAIIAAAVAAVELVALLVAGVVLVAPALGRHMRHAATVKALAPAAAPKKHATKPKQPTLTRGETSVLVLNGNGRTGAAAAEAQRIRGLGYMIGGVGNAPQTTYGRSVVMYRPGFRPEALRLARDTRILIVTPLDGLRRSAMQGAHVAVILGAG
jgi:LytR cell envelope-related transcriptional attenuator